MKNVKSILLVVGLFLEVSTCFAAADWKPTGPTLADIMAATAVENQAVKESLEDKLIKAVKNGDLKNVETLISQGVDLEARDDQNMTVLMIAAQKGYADIVSKLINAGADLDAINRYAARTAFFYAYESGHPETVKILIANGAAKNNEYFGETFVSAVFQGKNEMVKAFMVEGASIDHDTLDTAHSFAQWKCSAEVVNAIEELMTKTQG
jgi:ankyrin repeat protein